MNQPYPTFSGRASKQVDGSLVLVRWILGLFAWVLIALGTDAFYPSRLVGAWLALLAIFNVLVTLALRRKQIFRRLPLFGLIGDSLLFGILPYITDANSPLLFLFALYPTLVASLRFGALGGALVAITLALPYEVRALAGLLPPSVRAIVPVSPTGEISLLAASLPVAALFGSVILIGYLAQREREALVGDTAVELDRLRKSMEGARLFYETADTLSTSLSYSKVLDAMLEAGTNGMPPARKEDGPAIGVVLFFDETDAEKGLRVVAWRHLDRGDTKLRIPGKKGIVATTLERAEAVIFPEVATDPELKEFATLRRCRAGVAYPLQAALELYGVVILATPAPRTPSEQHLELMRAFTNQAGVAFQNARLYQSLRAERDHIIDAEASARAKLARDLHDGPTQSLAALAMRLDYIRMLLDRDPEKAKEEFGNARDTAVRIGKELRELLFTLRPLTLETQGLTATLKLWGQRMRDNEGVPLKLTAGDFGTELDANVAGTVFAVIEEAVNNARKHAGGAPIRVDVAKQNGNLIALVQDEGPGFDVTAINERYEERGSLGMVNMRERARLLDGQLSVDSAPGRGTRIMLVVPLTSSKTS